jgi:uncharacterized membrane protein
VFTNAGEKMKRKTLNRIAATLTIVAMTVMALMSFRPFKYGSAITLTILVVAVFFWLWKEQGYTKMIVSLRGSEFRVNRK